MSSVRHLKLIAGAGDPDPSLALRIDVITLAERFCAALDADDTDCLDYHHNVAIAEDRLRSAVRRMQRARAKRQGITP